jgi:hypothetical protein
MEEGSIKLAVTKLTIRGANRGRTIRAGTRFERDLASLGF